ncbi:MAG: efflux RND transporter periplasmic adaptor subunit [Deltaproteobacteria bacterium]|nr:efflux RND transporter periplasmic adaptor subunit [Deltaproteobacteria bacterium]
MSLLGLLLLWGCGGDLSAASGTKPTPLAVEAHVLKLEKRRPETRVVAELKPYRRALLRARIVGRVKKVAVRLGQRVRARATLLELADQALGLRLSAARDRRRGAAASTWRARRQWRRIRKLVRMGALPRVQLDRATSALRQARAGWRAQGAELAAAGSERKLHAPFSGWVADILVSPGDEVNIGQPLVKVVDTKRLRARVGVSAQQAAGMRRGDRFTLRVARREASGLTSQRYTGTVVAVGVAVDSRSRRVPVDLEVMGGSEGPPAGALAEATLFVGDVQDVLLIPEQSIVYRFDLPYVFVVHEGCAQRRRVEPSGRRWGQQVEVRKGIAPGELLVVAGQHRLAAGALVTLVEPEKSAAP